LPIEFFKKENEMKKLNVKQLEAYSKIKDLIVAEDELKTLIRDTEKTLKGIQSDLDDIFETLNFRDLNLVQEYNRQDRVDT